MKNGFLPFLCPKNARNTFGVRNSTRNWILWFCPANMPRTTQKPGIFLAFAKTHPKHFWHFHDQKSTRSIPIVNLSRSCTPRQPSNRKKKEINVVASKKAPETPRHGYSCLRRICGHKKAPDTPRGRFSCFRPNGSTTRTPKVDLFTFCTHCAPETPPKCFCFVFSPQKSPNTLTLSLFLPDRGWKTF